MCKEPNTEKDEKLFEELEEVLEVSTKVLDESNLNVDALKVIRMQHKLTSGLFERILGQEKEIKGLKGQIDIFTKLTDTQANVIRLLEEKVEEVENDNEMDWVECDEEPKGRLQKKKYEKDHTDESLVCGMCELEQNVFEFAKNPQLCRVCVNKRKEVHARY